MIAQDESAAPDVSGQTEPEEKATEQTQTEGKSYAAELLSLAKEDGYDIIGPSEPKSEEEKPETKEEAKPEETESEAETEPEVGETEGEDAEVEEEAATSEKKDEWPASAKQRVAEETDKRKRAIDRAEEAEAKLVEYEQRIAQLSGPRPTEDNRFADVQDLASLDRLERSFEKTIDLADDDPEALVEQLVKLEKERTGIDPLERFTAEQLVSMAKRKADKALRREIPDRRKYLNARATEDARAFEVYPELSKQSEFTQQVQQLVYRLLTGQAQRESDVLIWAARAVRGYQEELKRNGNGNVDSTVKQIVKSSKQRIAPTPTRTRSVVERGSSGSSLASAQKELKEKRSEDAAVNYVAALRSKGTYKKLEPFAE